jgi:CRISPR/Cas system CSM-associated protein Csm4 (group 5 of RAMP superfamily)
MSNIKVQNKLENKKKKLKEISYNFLISFKTYISITKKRTIKEKKESTRNR